MDTAVTFRNAIVATVGAGVACYLIFKRFEPNSPLIHLVLLALAPALLAPLLAPHVSSIYWAYLTALAIYNSTVLTSVIAYRLSPFHPLANYPGPIGCKLSKFWMGWVCLGGKQHLYYSDLHERYGDVVRIGPNEVSIRDVNAVNPLMGSDGLPKGPVWNGRIPESEVKALIALSGHEHTRRRKPWSRAFNSAALKGYEEIIHRRATILGQQLGKRMGQTVDLARWINFFTFDFMSEMAFGGGSEMMLNGDQAGVWHLLESGQTTVMFLGHIPWLGRYFMITPGVGKGMKAFRQYARGRAAVRHANGSVAKDAFHHLIDEDRIEAVQPSIAEVTSDGTLTIVAGSDTTASVLSNICWFLIRNQTVFRRVQDEVDRFFPPGEDAMVTTQHVNMPMINAVLNETLRLLPPVLSGSQRTSPKGGGGSAVGPYFLPEGTQAFMHFYSLHRDPRCFSPMPDVFWPDRWLPAKDRQPLHSAPDGKVPEKVIVNKTAFVPFSYGPAMCVGRNLAYMELRMVVCHLLQNFDMRFGDGYDPDQWERDIEDKFAASRGSLPVILSPRHGSTRVI